MPQRKPVRIMFLCTGNSCRSQMAEGLARALGGENVEVYSAGIEAHGLNPRAVAVMSEIGVDISGHTSDIIDPNLVAKMDYAITLCSDAEERCPVTPPTVTRFHWGFDDPAKASGTEEEVIRKFREVRDAIKSRIGEFLKGIGVSLEEN